MAATRRFVVPVDSPSHGDDLIANDDCEQGGLRVGKSLRQLLRIIVTEPAEMRAPREALLRLRPVVDCARRELRTPNGAGACNKQRARGLAHLADGAVAGLCHVARFCADESADSIVPTFAAVGIDLPRRHPAESSPLELLFVVSEDADARRRADRMVAFVLMGLSDLGFAINHACCAPRSTGALTQLLPATTLAAGNVRFVWGCFGLYDQLARRLPVSARDLRTLRN